jgi:hypothetical protein
MRSKPSDDALPSVAAPATSAEPEMNIALPPAHRIGAGNFGDMWMPTTAPAPADLPNLKQEKPDPPTSQAEKHDRPPLPMMKLPSIPSRKQPPVPCKRVVNGPPLPQKAPLVPHRPAPATAKSKPQVLHTERSDLSRSPQQAIRPVNIELRPEPPAIIAPSASGFPDISRSDMPLQDQTFHPVNIDLQPSSSSRHTSDAIVSIPGPDSSPPYLREKPSVDLARTERPVDQVDRGSPRKTLSIKVLSGKTGLQHTAQSGEKESALRPLSHDSSEPIGASDGLSIEEPTLEVTISPTSSPTPTLSSPLYSPITPLSSIITSPSSATFPDYLDHSRKSDPDRVPTPWLSVAFQDLPFGPDVPAVST